MARKRAAVRKDHTPRHGSDPAVQFAIDEIAQPTKPQPDRGRLKAQIEQRGKGKPFLPGEPGTSHQGSKQAAILNAEGERQAQQLKAEGFAIALTKIFESAKAVDQNTMTLQYLEALKRIGDGASTKFIFPLEFTSLMSDFIKRRNE